MALPAYDDIDLDLDPDEEEALLLAADKDEETKDEETKDEETKDEETKDEETKDEETKDEEAEDEETEELKEEAEEAEDSLEDIRQERVRLQEQLNELTVRSAMDGRKLAELERDLATKSAPAKPAAPEADPGPSPEEILAHLDQRVAAVDAALTKAELDDPSAAPPLRAQLRQLERYYTEYKANVIAEAARGPDPGALVQQAAEEAQQQARFSSVKNAVTEEYPNLNANGEYFNAELRDMVHEVYNPMLAQGADPTEALIKATTLVMRANGIPSVSEYNQQQAALAEKAEEAPVEAAAPAAKSRKKAAIERNIAAAAAAAPDISALGDSSKSENVLGKYDFASMDIKEFMRLTDEDEERIEGALAMYDGT